MATSKFHLSLNVNDLRTTASFLELLLNTKPAQLHPNYAKFELLDPPLVLSLIPTDLPSSGAINHLGFRLPNREALDAMQQRLRNAGVAHDIEDSVACCHSRQSKFWVHDPAGNLWEFYVLEDSQSRDSAAPAPADVMQLTSKTTTNSVWGHRLGDPIPDRIPADSASLGKIVLEGTFNAHLAPGQPAHLLAEAARALRPGGQLILHGLTADATLTAPPALPGPAARVEHVPTHREVLEAVELAGFVDIELVTFGESYSFSHAGTLLRELKLHATRPAGTAAAATHTATYRGPFAEIVDDSGRHFRRGQPTAIDQAAFNRLQQSAIASQFILERSNGQNSGENAAPASSSFDPQSALRP